LSGVAFAAGANRRENEAVVGAMLARMDHRARDGRQTWSSEHASIGFAAMWTTPEDAGEIAPRAGASGWIVAFDGRLDDRRGLSQTLGVPDEGPDARLVLLAIERWEEDAPDKLLGDFALVAWHEGRRRGLLARDYVGQRPLFYRCIGKSLRAASEMQALFPEGRTGARPNLGQLALLCVGEYAEDDETLIDGVRVVPPGHVATVVDGRVTTRRYWDPTRLGGGPSKPTAAADALEEALRAAVHARLRSPKPVAISVSGGLDSSLIAALARDAAAEHGDEAPLLLTIRFPGLGCDESLFTARLSRHLHLALRAVEATGLEGPARYERPAHIDLYPDPMPVLSAELAALAHREGHDAILTGSGSDELQWRTGLELHDAIHDGELAGVLRHAGLAEKPLSAGAWRQLGVAALRGLSRGWWARLRAGALREETVPDFLGPEAACSVKEARLGRRARFLSVGSLAQARVLEGLTASLQCPFGRGQVGLSAAVAGYELRDPFFDRRVAELLLSVSPAVRTDRPGGKPLTRAIAARHLPASLAYRTQPWTEFSAFFQRVETDASVLSQEPVTLRALGLIRPDGGAKLAQVALAEAWAARWLTGRADYSLE